MSQHRLLALFRSSTEPFKGLLVGVFLISVGMSLNIRTAVADPLLVFCAAGGMILLKLLVVTPLTLAFGLNLANGVRLDTIVGRLGKGTDGDAAPSTSRMPAARSPLCDCSGNAEVWFARDSPLEGAGFEPLVPPKEDQDKRP